MINKAHLNGRKLLDRMYDWFWPKSILVLSIGKTGSSSLILSLNANNIHAYQAHTLWNYPQSKLFISGLNDNKPVMELAYRIKILIWRNYIKLTGKKIIVIFRWPVMRDLSAFFEQLEQHYDTSKFNTDELFELFRIKGPHSSHKNWFLENLHKQFGLTYEDVHMKDCDYRIVNKSKLTFLFLKFEEIKAWENALEKFLNLKIEMHQKNLTREKPYSQNYKILKRRLLEVGPPIVAEYDLELLKAVYGKET